MKSTKSLGDKTWKTFVNMASLLSVERNIQKTKKHKNKKQEKCN